MWVNEGLYTIHWVFGNIQISEGKKHGNENEFGLGTRVNLLILVYRLITIYQLYELKGWVRQFSCEGVFFHLQPNESFIHEPCIHLHFFGLEDKAKIMEDIRPLFDGDEVRGRWEVSTSCIKNRRNISSTRESTWFCLVGTQDQFLKIPKAFYPSFINEKVWNR